MKYLLFCECVHYTISPLLIARSITDLFPKLIRLYKITPLQVCEKYKFGYSTPFNPLKILLELIGFFNKFFQFLLQNMLMDGLKDSVQ